MDISRKKTLPNGHFPEKLFSRMDSCQNVHLTEWTFPRKAIFQNGLLPEWTVLDKLLALFVFLSKFDQQDYKNSFKIVYD